jgi:hypothetical protein
MIVATPKYGAKSLVEGGCWAAVDHSALQLRAAALCAYATMSRVIPMPDGQPQSEAAFDSVLHMSSDVVQHGGKPRAAGRDSSKG